MCTGFVKHGHDLIFGYNLDIDPNVWNYRLVMNKDIFSVIITLDGVSYYTHGVTCDGNIACLPYMNDQSPFEKDCARRIDLLVNDYLTKKISFKNIKEIITNEVITNPKGGNFHALIGCATETILLEPGLKPKYIKDFEVISNYPILKRCDDDCPFYGKDRAKYIEDFLKKSPNITALDGLNLLQHVTQKEPWATRLSFVFSKLENTVYYILNNDGIIRKHHFDS